MHEMKLYRQQNGRTFHSWVRDIWEWIVEVSSWGLLALFIFPRQKGTFVLSLENMEKVKGFS